jgi:thymidylate synthase
MLNELNAFITANGDIREERIGLGHYYHSAGSFHVYETHFKMMSKIVQNYGRKHDKKTYPDLKKYKLKDTITMSLIKELDISLTSKDISKTEIKEHTRKMMEILYA